MRKRKSEDKGFNIWRSYSDMMAGVLLLFVLIMCVTLFQAQKNYNDTLRERDEKLAMEQGYLSEIEDKESRIQEQEDELSSQSVILAQQKTTLEEQEKQLAAQQTALDEKTKLLATQQTALDEKTELLAQQQAKIDNIIGIKAEVVESLKKEFEQNNISVNIDAQNGALTLEENVMFAPGESDLTKEGKNVLLSVLPIYCKVLLRQENLPSLAEIIIAGYTDTNGDYMYNLDLSQKRAQAVAEYLLEIAPEYLTNEECTLLEQYLTVNGHSKSHLVYDANGNVDMDASRRVEVKFRLKDEEMMEELNAILSKKD